MRFWGALAALLLAVPGAFAQNPYINFTNLPQVSGAFTLNDCVKVGTAGPPTIFVDAGGCASGTPNFSTIGAGTNANALVIGTGGSISASGSGSINATALGGATFAAPGALGGGTAAAGTFTTLTATSLNGNTFTTGTYTLTGVAGKTLTFNKSLTLDGTDSTTMTFPATSQTVAGLGTAETWTAVQTFTNSDVKLLGASTGATTFSSANAGASNFTITVPAVTDTLAVLGTAQTFSATQSFAGIISAGSKFTLGSGTGACTSTSTLTGGAQAGSFLCTGTAGASTQVVNLPTATNGWACWDNDRTSGVAGSQSASATTSATLKVTIATTSDVVNFGCVGY